MPAALYARWRAFYAAEPWGFRWNWLHTGTIASAVYNTSLNRKPGSKPLKAEQFVPEVRTTRKARSWQDTKLLFMGWCGISPHAVPAAAEAAAPSSPPEPPPPEV